MSYKLHEVTNGIFLHFNYARWSLVVYADDQMHILCCTTAQITLPSAQIVHNTAH